MSRRSSRIVQVPAEPGVVTHPDNIIRRASVNPDFGILNDSAALGAKHEQDQTIWEAVKQYPKAVGWSLLLSTAVIMEGYDTVLITSFFALTPFLQRYGTLQPDGTYNISAAWEQGLANASYVGEILGLQLTGIVQDRFGYRKTILGALVLMVIFIFIVFFAQSLPVLLIGEILCGIPWGTFQTLTTAYAAEVCPVKLRPYLTTYVNLCWVIGQLISAGVLAGLQTRPDQWSYRIPFAIQWIWPIPLIIGCSFAPESPWWLVRQGRVDAAKHSLMRLTSRNAISSSDLDNTIAMIKHTDDLEKEISSGTSYFDCFKGVDLRRTEIVAVVWLIQNTCGSSFTYYSNLFYEDAGLSETAAFHLTIVQYALGVVGTVLSWFLMKYVGRRTIYLQGCNALFVILIIAGFLGLAPSTNTSAQWAIGSMLILTIFVYDLTVGPICYSLVAELSSTRLRAKSIVIARNIYNISGIVCNVLTTYQLNTAAWNWGAKSAFFWAGADLLGIIWIYYRLPEPKDRTYGELDVLFESKVPARKFRETRVDPYRGGNATTQAVEGKDGEVEEVEMADTKGL